MSLGFRGRRTESANALEQICPHGRKHIWPPPSLAAMLPTLQLILPPTYGFRTHRSVHTHGRTVTMENCPFAHLKTNAVNDRKNKRIQTAASTLQVSSPFLVLAPALVRVLVIANVRVRGRVRVRVRVLALGFVLGLVLVVVRVIVLVPGVVPGLVRVVVLAIVFTRILVPLLAFVRVLVPVRVPTRVRVRVGVRVRVRVRARVLVLVRARVLVFFVFVFVLVGKNKTKAEICRSRIQEPHQF